MPNWRQYESSAARQVEVYADGQRWIGEVKKTRKFIDDEDGEPGMYRAAACVVDVVAIRDRRSIRPWTS